jgi:hypothetical protein
VKERAERGREEGNRRMNAKKRDREGGKRTTGQREDERDEEEERKRGTSVARGGDANEL